MMTHHDHDYGELGWLFWTLILAPGLGKFPTVQRRRCQRSCGSWQKSKSQPTTMISHVRATGTVLPPTGHSGHRFQKKNLQKKFKKFFLRRNWYFFKVLSFN
jgi:hypothetical protein